MFLSLYLAIILLAGLGRLTYILTALALLMIIVLHRKRIHAGTIGLMIIFAFAGFLIFYYAVLSSANRDVISYAFTSAFNWWDAVKMYGDLSLAVDGDRDPSSV
jgi:hypothetical protein